MTYSFRTNGDVIEFVHTDNTSLHVESIIHTINNTSTGITWSFGEYADRISFSIDQTNYTNILITEIDFDGVSMDSQDDFETGITAMFPGLAGGGPSSGSSVAYNLVITQDANQTSGVLIVGRRYTVTTLEAGDDFANVGYVSTDVEFVATGTTPTDWSNGSNVVPTPINSIDNDIYITRSQSGSYDATSDTAIFTTGKTFALPLGAPGYSLIQYSSLGYTQMYANTNNAFRIETYSDTNYAYVEMRTIIGSSGQLFIQIIVLT